MIAMLSGHAANAQRDRLPGGDVEQGNIAATKKWNSYPPPPADLRDFQGGSWATWTGFDNAYRPVTDTPMSRDESIKLVPMTPREAASRQHRLAMTAAGTPVADASADCLPHGMPRIMASSYPIQFDYTPEMIFMLDEVTHDVRYIHMDGKPAPADEPLSFMGYSRGHWEGNTLVVETDHLNDRSLLDEESLSHGTKLKLREEFSRFINKYGGNELRNRITIDDPEHFTRPWTTERTYPWQPDRPIIEYTCEENNRNKSVDGKTVAK